MDDFEKQDGKLREQQKSGWSMILAANKQKRMENKDY